MNTASPSRELQVTKSASEGAKEFLTFMIGAQRFGIPILQVQDVLGAQRMTKIPLTPPEVAGSLNLRGRIVTAINVRSRLGMSARNNDENNKNMSVVVEHDGELYSLIIDRVSDVMNLSNSSFENSPATLDSIWRDISSGIYRLDGELLIIIDVSKLLETIRI